MIASIAAKEFRDVLRDGRFKIAAGVVVALLSAALLLGARQAGRVHAERDAAATQERRNWVEQGEKNSHSAAHFGVYAFKPFPPLAAIDRGIEPFVGTTVLLEAHRQNPAAFLPAQDATTIRRFGELTAAVGLQQLLPLLIIFLAFGAIAGERDRGTLRQVLSLGVAPRDLLLGKALGLGGVLALLLLPVALVGVFVGATLPGDGVWLRSAGLVGAYVLYLSAVLAACLTVSALAPRARTALAILLVAWTANMVLAPRIAADVSRVVFPTPKLAEFEEAMGQALKNGLDGHSPNSEKLQEFARRTLEAHGKTRLEDLPFNFHGLVMIESERLAGEVFDHHFGRLWDLLATQDRLVAGAGLAAPLLGARSASMALAGTDFAHHRHFAVAAERHRRDFVRALNEEMMKDPRGGHGVYGKAFWEKLPAFRYEPPSAGFAFRAALPGLAVLLIWAVGAWSALLAAAPRMRPG